MAKKTTQAPPPGIDLSALGEEGRPYHYRFGESMAQHSMASTALEISRKTGLVIAIYDNSGKPVRLLDARLEPAAPGPEREKKPATGAAAAGRVRTGTKQERAIALLKRDQGATTKELSAEMGWSMGQWHVDRIQRVTGWTLEVLGDRHWRLVQPK